MHYGSEQQRNSGKTIGRPFPKGVSGNPSGRPKGLIPAIRKTTKDGKLLAEFLVKVLQDENAHMKDRLKAAEILAEKGFSKPTPDNDAVIGGSASINVRFVPPEEILAERLQRGRQRARLSKTETGIETSHDEGIQNRSEREVY